MNFNTMPLTYRSGLIKDSIELCRNLTCKSFVWTHFMISSNLFLLLERETLNIEYLEDAILLRFNKAIVHSDKNEELPPNSIIVIDMENQ